MGCLRKQLSVCNDPVQHKCPGTLEQRPTLLWQSFRQLSIGVRRDVQSVHIMVCWVESHGIQLALAARSIRYMREHTLAIHFCLSNSRCRSCPSTALQHATQYILLPLAQGQLHKQAWLPSGKQSLRRCLCPHFPAILHPKVLHVPKAQFSCGCCAYSRRSKSSPSSCGQAEFNAPDCAHVSASRAQT